MTSLRISRLPFFFALFCITVAVAACGSSSNSTSTSSGGGTKTATPGLHVKADPKVAAAVPAAIKSKGTLTIAADASYPPDEYFAPDGKTIIGMDADLAKALAQVMGLKASIQNATFDSIIPGLAANKYDLGMSSFGDTKVRQKTVDFVTYLQAGASFYVKAQGGPNIQTLADLCGHKVAVEKGTTEETDATGQDAKCKAAGKPAVTVSVFPDQNAANLAVSSGRADVGIADTPAATYIVQKNGQFKLSGKQYAIVPYGIAMPKNSGLSKPVLDAVKALMADGNYAKILKYWDLSQAAISNPQINGATS